VRSSVQGDEAATRRPDVEREETRNPGEEETGMRSLVGSTVAIVFLSLDRVDISKLIH